MNVVDSKNINYEVLSKLSESSHGVTYLLKDNKHIVKLFNNKFDHATLKSKIDFLINLGLDKDVFAIPLKQISQPKYGYISEFNSGMISLSSLKPPKKDKNLLEYLLYTGGLLKRYNILIRLAYLLQRLHSMGLVFCDLSPDNVFISENPNSFNVFLNDLDNLRYKTSILNNTYTPFYGAPEVLTQRAPNTTMSDCFSFAVLAYELLTFNHPLIGDYVLNGGPELEKYALTGKLPWIEHSENNINKKSSGLPSEKVMPEKLLNLFRKNFEAGLNNPFARPNMVEWFDILSISLSELLKCGNSNCTQAYPYNNNNKCTFCGYKPNRVIQMQIQRWEKVEYFCNKTHKIKHQFSLHPVVYNKINIDENTPKEITSFNFLSTNLNPLTPILKIEYVVEHGEFNLIFTPLNGVKFYISSSSGLIESGNPIVGDSSNEIVIDMEQLDKHKYMFHLKDLNTPQRVLTVGYYG